MTTTSKPDLQVTNLDWIEVFATSGVAPSSSVSLFNKSVNNAIVSFSEDKPSADSDQGVMLSSYQLPYASMNITGQSKIWLKCVRRTASIALTVEQA